VTGKRYTETGRETPLWCASVGNWPRWDRWPAAEPRHLAATARTRRWSTPRAHACRSRRTHRPSKLRIWGPRAVCIRPKRGLFSLHLWRCAFRRRQDRISISCWR